MPMLPKMEKAGCFYATLAKMRLAPVFITKIILNNHVITLNNELIVLVEVCALTVFFIIT